MSSPGGVRNWPWQHVMEVLRRYGPYIGVLAKRGDALARKLVQRYQYAYDHPRDRKANAALRDALDDFLRRDLRDAERTDLGSRFGYMVDDGNGSKQ